MVIAMKNSMMRARWAAVGAAVAVSLGGGVVMVANAGGPPGPSDELVYVSIPTCRIVDTRDLSAPTGTDVGSFARLGDGETILVDIDDSVHPGITCEGLPASGVEAVNLNVTAINSSTLSFIVLYPGDVLSRPVGSNLNFKSGDAPTANQAVVRLGSIGGDNGLFNLYNHDGTVDVVVDVNGYYVCETDACAL